ncbi:MAG: Crp/Fnr family transcriptional regulator [Acetivibrionales bacterium]|jgi:CRP-like cAMP-binding protein
MHINSLKQIPLLADVDENMLSELIKSREIYERKYKRNTTIHSRDDKCTMIDVVMSGSLVAYSLAQNGSESIMTEFKTGSIIAANLLFGDNNVFPFNIYCMTDSHLLHLTKSAVCMLLKDYNFVMRFIKSISQNSQGMNRKIVMFSQKSLRKNILDYLFALSIKQRSDIVLLPLTKKQLADYFGVQRPSLFRVLKELKDEGLIEVYNRKIKIKFEV